MVKEKPQIFGIGITGLVGSRIVELLKDTYTFTNLSLETGVDITDPTTLEILQKDTGGATVLQLAAKADVDGCEKDKGQGKEGAAWKINVLGTENIVNACKKFGKKIIYISTDFVFDGEIPDGKEYIETDTPNPIDYYGETKYQGEKVIQRAGLPFVILRIAYPYRAHFVDKKDFVRTVIDLLQEGKPIKMVTDHVMTPTFIDDIAKVLNMIIKTKRSGIYHVVGSQTITPYAAGKLIARTFGFDQSLILPTTRKEFFAGRAPRPFRLALNNAKIQGLGIKMSTFEEGLRKVKEQIHT